VFAYLIARGKGMQERQIAELKARNEATQQYIQQVAGTRTGASEEIARLADLRDKGTITEEEFQSLKAKALA
jgi:multidrug resistance efflux pump